MNFNSSAVPSNHFALSSEEQARLRKENIARLDLHAAMQRLQPQQPKLREWCKR